MRAAIIVLSMLASRHCALTMRRETLWTDLAEQQRMQDSIYQKGSRKHLFSGISRPNDHLSAVPLVRNELRLQRNENVICWKKSRIFPTIRMRLSHVILQFLQRISLDKNWSAGMDRVKNFRANPDRNPSPPKKS